MGAALLKRRPPQFYSALYIESMVSELETSFEQFQKAEQKFWKELE